MIHIKCLEMQEDECHESENEYLVTVDVNHLSTS